MCGLGAKAALVEWGGGGGCLLHLNAKVLNYEGVGRGDVTHTQIQVSHIRTCDVRCEV